jgi:hypothetical protein
MQQVATHWWVAFLMLVVLSKSCHCGSPFFVTCGKQGVSEGKMRGHKQIGVRLSEGETKLLEQLARDKELTISELVRLWLEQAAREAWHKQQGKGV